MSDVTQQPWAWRKVEVADTPREFIPASLLYENPRALRYKCAAPRVKPDWKAPHEMCECGGEAILTAHLDVDEWRFGWDCDECDAWDDDTIYWPFIDRIAWPEDLEALGFEVV